jgi:hypothetical protein
LSLTRFLLDRRPAENDCHLQGSYEYFPKKFPQAPQPAVANLCVVGHERDKVIVGQGNEPLSGRYDAAVKIGASQIRLDAGLLGDKWKVLLEEIPSPDCACSPPHNLA